MTKTVYHMEGGKLLQSEAIFGPHPDSFTYWDKETKRRASGTLGHWFFLDQEECLKSAYAEEVAFVEETRVELEMLKEALATAEVFLPATFEEFKTKVLSCE